MNATFSLTSLRRSALTLWCVAVATFALNSAHATPITLNSGGAPQPANSGQGTIESWIGGLVTTYNAANNPDLPAPGLEIFRVNNGDVPPSGYPSFGDNKLSITIPTGGYDFIALHWGGPGGGVYQAFYIGNFGADTSYTFNAPSENGLSWYDGFHPSTPNAPAVPDGGSTSVLLGLAFLSVALLGRKRILS